MSGTGQIRNPGLIARSTSSPYPGRSRLERRKAGFVGQVCIKPDTDTIGSMRGGSAVEVQARTQDSIALLERMAKYSERMLEVLNPAEQISVEAELRALADRAGKVRT